MGASTRRVRLGEVALLVFGLCFSLLVADFLFRVLTPDAHYVWPPNFRQILQPIPELMPGIQGEAVFQVNAAGMRGDPLPDDGRYRILAVGGSTTACGFLDDSEAWPHLVQEEVNAALGAASLWVGNIGRAGHNSAHHALQVEKLLAQYDRIDALVLLVGLNDLLLRLIFDRERDYREYLTSPQSRQRLMSVAFSVFPGHDVGAPWYRRTGFERFWRTVRWRWLADRPVQLVQDDFGEIFDTWRQHRRSAATIRARLPELASAIDYYVRNLDRIVEASRAAGSRVVFLTQPVSWHAGLSDGLRDLLWMGGVGNYQTEPGHDYYSVEALARGMERYNSVLRNLARAHGVELIDLAADLSRDPSIFFDDAHFNERGAQAVAHSISRHLLAHPPFAGGSQGGRQGQRPGRS